MSKEQEKKVVKEREKSSKTTNNSEKKQKKPAWDQRISVSDWERAKIQLKNKWQEKFCKCLGEKERGKMMMKKKEKKKHFRLLGCASINLWFSDPKREFV